MIKENLYPSSPSSFSQRPLLDETPAFDILFPQKLTAEDKEALEAIKEELEEEKGGDKNETKR